jgi:hypothetical protein
MQLYISVAAISSDLAARLHGPGALRFYLQPAVAATLGIVAGVKDARAGRPAFLWDSLRGGPGKVQRRRAGLKQVFTPFVAVGMDVVLQWIILREVRLGAAFAVGVALIYVPYILTRGPINRLLSLRSHHHAPNP